MAMAALTCVFMGISVWDRCIMTQRVLVEDTSISNRGVLSADRSRYPSLDPNGHAKGD